MSVHIVENIIHDLVSTKSLQRVIQGMQQLTKHAAANVKLAIKSFP